jgi:hypothetical protein
MLLKNAIKKKIIRTAIAYAMGLTAKLAHSRTSKFSKSCSYKK